MCNADSPGLQSSRCSQQPRADARAHTVPRGGSPCPKPPRQTLGSDGELQPAATELANGSGEGGGFI